MKNLFIPVFTVGTKEHFALCQAADAATTVLVLGKGSSEANPLRGQT